MAKPVLIARAKIAGKDPPRWTTIGVAFRAQFEGGISLSVQLDSIPFNWDGSFVLKPPAPNDDPPHDPETDEIR
jgi:hypothetical protein